MIRTLTRLPLTRLPLIALLAATQAACVSGTGPEEPVRILRSTTDGVVLHGLIDATRKSPPDRYDILAQSECARSGRQAVLIGMEQKSTFGFDVTYRCVSKT
ncbi:hypothetical protein M3484_22645 [Pseudomonas sp. GX19020]|uniref:hypothetical protein n=1 Tax=Pseudomonas sp. GX19020 TaxID=2942277 RepID=UPI002019C9E0|nr:hypothetical protein [Pseudomonas sp. GX19020]MCL4069361.1 hypothetical protein [Pseudomonas sp. GX19020]